MSDTTHIEWCDATWSPWEGCQKVGPGCDHCYAEARNQRFAGGANWGPGAARRKTAALSWRKPLQWAKAAKAEGRRMRVFPSLCDPFDNAVDPSWRAEFFDLIVATPEIDWLLLTKRIGNVSSMVPAWLHGVLPANVWLGATVVNQTEADRDIPKLLAAPARVRFLSIEPMLGPVDITPFLWGKHEAVDVVCQNCPRDADCSCGYETRSDLRLPALHWVIAGGESGQHARPAHTDWFRGLRDQCAAAGVPFLFKQWGEWAPDDGSGGFVGITRVLHAASRGIHRVAAGDDVYRFGKKSAGRLLDGITHDGVPTP